MHRRALRASCALLLLVPAGLAQIYPEQFVLTSVPAERLLLADLDQDGRDDLVWAEEGTTFVARRLSGPLGVPQAELRQSLNLDISALTAGQMNGTGWLELVALIGSPGQMVVYEASSFGFTFKSTHTAATGSLDVVLHDLGGDGDLDAIVAETAFHRVLVFLAPGPGFFFGPATILNLNGSLESPVRVALEVLTGSGLPDILSACDGTENVQVHTATGSGETFGVMPTSTATILDGVDDMAVGDLNGDGWVDVSVVDPNAGEVNVLQGSAGGFSAPTPQAPYPAPVALEEIEADGDASTELAVLHQTLNIVRVVDFGSVPFIGVTGIVALPTVAPPSCLAEGDVNGDGRADLVVGSNFANRLSLLVQGPDGPMDFRTEQLVGTGDGPVDVALADMDGDDDLDVVTLTTGVPKAVETALNDGQGVLAAPLVATFNLNGASVLAAGDVDGDHDADVAVAGDNDKLRVLLNDGAGGLTLGTSLDHGSPPGLTDLELADVDDDFDLDLVGLGRTGPGNGAVIVMLNDGVGAFDDPTAHPSGFDMADRMVLADLDADGDLDVAACRTASDLALVSLGDGAGGFAAAASFTVGDQPVAIAAGDVDEDGDLDLVVGRGDAGSDAELLLNNGGGVFSAPSLVTLFGGLLADAGLSDIDRDGDPDLLACLQGTEVLAARLNEPGIAFLPDLAHTLAGNLGSPLPVALAFGDLDGDLLPEAVTALADADQLSVLSNLLPSAWTDLGQGLVGARGKPRLEAFGSLAGGTPVSFVLDNALPSSTVAMVVGLFALNAPFKGGTMVPALSVLIPGLPTGAQGRLVLPAIWPTGLPSGLALYFQDWVSDAAGPKGFAASNALEGVTP